MQRESEGQGGSAQPRDGKIRGEDERVDFTEEEPGGECQSDSEDWALKPKTLVLILWTRSTNTGKEF